MQYSSPIQRRGRTAAGFTLIELLVVISLIVMLIAILLPALAKARDAGRTTVCLSNMRQIGLQLNSYVAEHSDMLPAACYIDGQYNQGLLSSTWNDLTWQEAIALGRNIPFSTTADGVFKVYRCPSRPNIDYHDHHPVYG